MTVYDVAIKPAMFNAAGKKVPNPFWQIYVEYGTKEAEEARLGCCPTGWIRNPGNAGDVQELVPGVYHEGFDESKSKRQIHRGVKLPY